MNRTVMGIGGAILCLIMAGLPLTASAEPPRHGGGMAQHGQGGALGMGHGPGHGMMGGGHGMGGDHDGHGLAPSWRASLTDDQKGEISWSHLRLRQNQSLVEAQIALKKAEIDDIVLGESGSEEALQSAVDELMELKKEKTLNHYRHIMELRQLLTPQQRVSFDLGILSGKGGHK